MTREKLLSLSNKELALLAQNYDIEIDANNFERNSVIDDLWEEIAHEITNNTINASVKRYEFHHDKLSDQSIFEFPSVYNESYLYFLLRDPYWSLVFWEIDKKTYETATTSSNFNGFFLRLSCIKTVDGKEFEPEFIDISIEKSYGKQFIQLINPQMNHRIALFADFGNVEAMIMVTSVIFGSYAAIQKTDNLQTKTLCKMSEQFDIF